MKIRSKTPATIEVEIQNLNLWLTTAFPSRKPLVIVELLYLNSRQSVLRIADVVESRVSRYNCERNDRVLGRQARRRMRCVRDLWSSGRRTSDLSGSVCLAASWSGVMRHRRLDGRATAF